MGPTSGVDLLPVQITVEYLQTSLGVFRNAVHALAGRMGTAILRNRNQIRNIRLSKFLQHIRVTWKLPQLALD